VMMEICTEMKYVYDFYLDGVRVDTTTNVHDSYRQAITAATKEQKWAVHRTEALTEKFTVIESLDELESDIIMVERRAWHDVETKKAMKWEPFNEVESGIHFKDKPIDNNVKTAAAISKPRTSAVPPKAILALGAAMQDGANKYGLFNWRETSVSATVFYDAIMRHMLAWYSGEDDAPDSKQSHLAHIMANCAILLDAPDAGVFKDDRNKKCKI
jgi:hypothetical protein